MVKAPWFAGLFQCAAVAAGFAEKFEKTSCEAFGGPV